MSDFMNKQARFPDPHPLKAEFRKRKIPLWCLRNYTGVSEPKLSRYLNNIDNMPLDVQIKLYQLFEMLEGNFSSVDEKQFRAEESVSVKPYEMLGEENKK